MEKEKLIEKINDLYILQRWRYLILNKKGEYITVKYYKDKKKGSPLTDYQVERHLLGNHTLGVFAGRIDKKDVSKFITFDVDVKDKEKAKWTVYKLINAITDMGIDYDYIYTSYSGNKGYHIDLFFENPVEVDLLKQFHEYILIQSELENIDFGEVELRPTLTQGVKIPLGYNFKNTKTDNKCCFVDFDNGLNPIEKEDYILGIKKIDTILFRLLLDKALDIDEDEITEDTIKDYNYIQTKYKQLDIYKINIDENITLSSLEKLEQEGLTRPSTRHNSLFKLCRYYKYLGLTEESNKEELINWLGKQDKNYYSSKQEECIKDIDNIVKYVYENNLGIINDTDKDIKISYSEIKQLLNAKSKNEKLTLFALVLHSKKYASKDGVFYCSYSLLEKCTSITRKTLINCINSLEKQGLLEIVQRNKAIVKDNKFLGKEANKYKVLINFVEEKEFYIIEEEENYADILSSCILHLCDRQTIKHHCGRRYSEHIFQFAEDYNININVA